MLKKILFFVLIAGSLSAKESLLIYNFQDIGIMPATVQTALNILKTDIENSGKYGKVGTAYNLTPNNITEAISMVPSGYEKAVFGTFGALGEKVIVTATLVDISSATQIISVSLSAVNSEELETVMKRIANSIVLEKGIKSSANIENIVEKENKEPKRRASFATMGLMLPFTPYTTDTMADYYRPFDLRYIWQYETPTFMARISNTSFLAGFGIQMGIYYLFSKTDKSPYAGIDVGYIFNTYSIDGGGAGTRLSIGGGLMLLRTYDFHLLLETSMDMDIYQGYKDYSGNWRSGTNVFSLRLGIGMVFKRSKAPRGCMMGGCLF